MPKKICFLSCHNQYDSKSHFTKKLSEAFLRKGVLTDVLIWPYGPCPEAIVEKIRELQPCLTASFHQLPPQGDGIYFWDRLKIPHWTLLLDPAFYDLELMKSSYSLISCVDRKDCALLASYHFPSTFFFPHAVERELIDSSNHPRSIDVLMLGTCYDPEHLYKFWKKNYSKKIVRVLEEAADLVLNEQKISFVQALLQTLLSHGIDLQEVEFDRLAHYVDSYSRGVDRLRLIRSIRDVEVHVYGGKCWREEEPIADWSYYLATQANVTVHPAVGYTEAIGLMQRSKICLNSMPFFKDGSHERFFTAFACGAIPISSESLYLQEISPPGDLLFYSASSLSLVNDKVSSLVSDALQRTEIVAQGQKMVLNGHTWDHRVDEALKLFSTD